MSKRYRKMQKKANGRIREIRDGQVILELPLPVADVLSGIPEAIEGLSQEVGLMIVSAVIESRKHSGKDSREEERKEPSKDGQLVGQ